MLFIVLFAFDSLTCSVLLVRLFVFSFYWQLLFVWKQKKILRQSEFDNSIVPVAVYD